MYIIDKRSATELAAAIEQRRDPGPLIQVRIVASHNSFFIL